MYIIVCICVRILRSTSEDMGLITTDYIPCSMSINTLLRHKESLSRFQAKSLLSPSLTLINMIHINIFAIILNKIPMKPLLEIVARKKQSASINNLL